MEWGVDMPKESHWNLARIEKRQGDIVNGVYRLSVWSHSKWIQWTLVCPSSIWTFIFSSFYFIFFPHFLFILLNFSSMEICLVWSIPFSPMSTSTCTFWRYYMCILGRKKMNEWTEPAEWHGHSIHWIECMHEWMYGNYKLWSASSYTLVVLLYP